MRIICSLLVLTLSFSSPFLALEDLDFIPVLKNGKVGYVDSGKHFRISPQFDDGFRFSDGLAAVRVGSVLSGRYGYIDYSGSFVIEPQFEIAGPFREGFAYAMKDGLFGYIDKTGEWVVNPRFEEAGNVSDGRAVVVLDGKEQVITLRDNLDDPQPKEPPVTQVAETPVEPEPAERPAQPVEEPTAVVETPKPPPQPSPEPATPPQNSDAANPEVPPAEAVRQTEPAVREEPRSAQSTTPELDSYFPTKLGMSWIYRTVTGSDGSVLLSGERKISSFRREPNRIVFSLEGTDKVGPAEMPVKTVYQLYPDRLILDEELNPLNKPTSVKLDIIRTPLKTGQTWENVSLADLQRIRFHMLSVDTSVTVPAGTFDNCLAIRESPQDDKTRFLVNYYAPGIGLVLSEKYRFGEVATRKELVAFFSEN